MNEPRHDWIHDYFEPSPQRATIRLMIQILLATLLLLATCAPVGAAAEYESETAPRSQFEVYGRPFLSNVSYPVIGLAEVKKIDKKKVFIYKLEGTDKVLARHNKIKGVKDLRPISERSVILNCMHKTFIWGLPLVGAVVGGFQTARNIAEMW